MRGRLAFVLLAAGALSLAGCLGSPQPQAPEKEKPSAQPVAQPGANNAPAQVQKPIGQVVKYAFKGHLNTSLGASGVGYLSPTGSQDVHAWTFAVDTDAVAIVAEMRWQDKTMDLDLELGSPTCDSTTGAGMCIFADGGSPGNGDTPVKLVFKDPKTLAQAGAWKVVAWGKDAVNTDFEAAVSVFYNVGPEDSYTAFH